MSYKIYPSQFDMTEQRDISIVDLLTNPGHGVAVSIIVKPRHSWERKDIQGKFTKDYLAISYGSAGGLFWNMYHLFLATPSSIKDDVMKGPLYALDLTSKNKEFCTVRNPSQNVFNEMDKITDRSNILIGSIDEVLDEFRSRGYTFSGKDFDFRRDRKEKIVKLLKKNKIFRSGLNEDVYDRI